MSNKATIVLNPLGQLSVVCPYDGFTIVVPPNDLRSMHPVDLIGDVIASCSQCAYRKQHETSRWPEDAEL